MTFTQKQNINIFCNGNNEAMSFDREKNAFSVTYFPQLDNVSKEHKIVRLSNKFYLALLLIF